MNKLRIGRYPRPISKDSEVEGDGSGHNIIGLWRSHFKDPTVLGKPFTTSTTLIPPMGINDLFVPGKNNTAIVAQIGSTVVLDCLIVRPNLDEHAPVSLSAVGILGFDYHETFPTGHFRSDVALSRLQFFVETC